MINSYTITTQTVGVNAPIEFNVNKILTGCTVQHAEGTPTFTLTKPGYYFVSFNGVATGVTGQVDVQLFKNATEVPGTLASSTLAETTDTENLSFSTIIRVLPSCCVIDNTVKLQVINTGIEATFSTVNINITKLC